MHHRSRQSNARQLSEKHFRKPHVSPSVCRTLGDKEGCSRPLVEVNEKSRREEP